MSDIVSERVLLPSAVVPSHYTVTLIPDLELLTFQGKVDINVSVSAITSEISLHSKEIQVKSVSFKSVSSVQCIGINYNLKLTTVTFVFDGPLAEGNGLLSIEYSGILNGDMAGFYKSAYTDADGKKKIMASTQFEALDARRAMPCWDEPARKATFTVVMIIPSHLQALSNMPEAEILTLPGLKRRVTFEKTPIMSTYLLAWAVGEFDFVAGVTKGGVALRVITPPGRASQGKFALDVGIRSLDFFDEFFQVPYPLPKLDMLCVTEFAMGAMENWGLVTYRENALMIDEEKASSQTKQRVAVVIAHELAHQWFGNLVTMSWWDGLWLNEGFASFMENLATDSLFPDYKIWDQFVTGHFAQAQGLDAMRSSHPIIVPIKHAEEVEQVFDAISYCKGSTVVKMLYHTLGVQHFREGLQLYMRRHAYGNTETKDLWTAWAEVSGLDVNAMMDTWTTKMGYPYLSVVSESFNGGDNDTVEVTLKQQWFLSDGSAETESAEAPAPVWHIPLLFATKGSVSEAAVIMDQQQQTFTIPLAAGGDDFLKINAGQKALVRVGHSPEMLRRLSANVSSSTSTLTSVDVASLLLDGFALLKAGHVSFDSVVAILKSIDPGAADSTVWSAISGVLSSLQTILEEVGGEAYDNFSAFAKAIVTAGLLSCGWETKASDGHTDKLKRASIMSLLDKFAGSDAEVLKESRERFENHFADSTALPAEYKSSVYSIVLMNGGSAEYERILKTFYATEDNQEKKYAFSLGATNDLDLKTRTLDWAVKSGDVKLQDFFYPIASVASSRAGSDLAWRYFQDNFAFIKDKLAKASPSLMGAVISYSISRFCTVDKAAEIEAFFAANPLPSSTRVIAQILERMRTNAKLLEIVKQSNMAEETFWK